MLLDVCTKATTGWIGFSSAIIGTLCSIGIGMVMDKFKRRMKLAVQVLVICSIILLAILCCIQEHYIRIPQQFLIGLYLLYDMHILKITLDSNKPIFKIQVHYHFVLLNHR